jgi:hypothetical protein
MSSEYPLSLVIKAVDKATAPLRKVNAEITKATQPVRSLASSLGALSKESGLTAVMGAAQGVGKSLRNVGSEASALAFKLVGIGAAAGFGIYSLVRSTVDAGDKLAEVSQRVGLTADAFAQLSFAAAQSDVEQEQFNAAMDTFNKRLGEAKAGGGPLLQFLEKVSPALANQVKHAKGTEAAFGLMTRAMEKVQDPAKRSALAAAVFGKGSLQMGQFLGQGGKAIDAYRKRFLELSGSQEGFAKGASDVDNAMRESETAFLGLRNAAATALFPAITQLSQAVTGFLLKNREGIKAWAEKTGAAISAWVQGGGLERLTESLGKIAAAAASIIDKVGGMGNVLIGVAGIMAGPTISATLGLASSLGKLGIETVLFLGKTSGFTGWAAGWIQYLWMMRGSIMAGLIPSLISATAAAWSFTAALLANPITWIIAGIIALGVAVYLIYKNWAPIKKFFIELWDSIVGAFKSAWEKIRPIAEKVADVMQFSPIGLALKGGMWVADKLLGDGSQPARPTLNTDRARPGSGKDTQAKVSVDFTNLPKGARVSQAPGNDAPLDLSMGWSMVTQ